MIGKKMLDALNEQINAELYSSYLYLAMAADFQARSLKGFANWMEVQSREEAGHAKKLYEFLVDRGGRIALKAIDAPPAEWKSALAAFEASYAHEQKVTGMIHKLVELAEAEGDHAAAVMLQWFVTEQVEEEASASEIVEKLRLVKDSAQGLLLMDSLLAQRK
jgi:ferritin